jgi:hypothetical protein
METKNFTELSTVSTAYHHHFKRDFNIFQRINNVIGAILLFLWEITFYLIGLSMRILLAGLCIAGWIVFFLYLEVKRLIKMIHYSGIFIIFVSLFNRISIKNPRE